MNSLPSNHPTAQPSVRGVILAGGGATRFGGRLKGLESVGGVRIIDRLVDAFEEALGQLPLLVANDPNATAWRPDLEVVADARPGLGSLGGILTAVTARHGPAVCVAWDMPFVPSGLIAELAAGLDQFDAFLPESGGRRGVEPLCAGYGPACGPAIEARLAQGDLRAISFHDSVKVGILSGDRIRQFGDPAVLFFNVNAADDLVKAEDLCRRHASSR